MLSIGRPTKLSRHRVAAVLTAAALVVASSPAPIALAGGSGSKAAAIAAARAEARTLARQTHASSYKVVSCRKSTATRWLCEVETDFKSGARRCTAMVTVTFKSGRARTSYSKYSCY
jgi:hypothetical protein